jgi:hypothetical protein
MDVTAHRDKKERSITTVFEVNPAVEQCHRELIRKTLRSLALYVSVPRTRRWAAASVASHS